MKLIIRCASIASKKSNTEIVVGLHENTTISDLRALVIFEHWLNEHTNARFHIDVREEEEEIVITQDKSS